MQIYVNSRGESQDEDYCWLKITQDRQPSEIPFFLAKPIQTEAGDQVRISDLIQSEAPSVVLARKNGNLILLVTGLDSSERRDFVGRKIRNSVAWLGGNSDEPYLRGLAAKALREKDWLKDKVDKAVTFGGEYGFQVAFEEISELSEGKVGNNFVDSQDKVGKNSQTLRKVGKNSQVLREKLALELEQYELPKEDGPLVVVTGIQEESALKNAGVWRGLSSLVQSEQWIAYKKNSSAPHREEGDRNSQAAGEENTKIRRFAFQIILIGVVILLGFAIFLVIPK